MSVHRIDHGAFCVWKYNGPGKKARGFWHADMDISQPLWAYALRSNDGTYWETSRAKGGFRDEQSAVNAAQAVVSAREQAWEDLRADGGLPEAQ
jgi:hypothetical protein